MLPDSWPEVMPSERCNQVTAGEEEKRKENKEEGDFPIDPKYSKVLALVREYSDVFHDHLDETDRLCEGVLDLKLKPGAEPYLTNRVQRVNFHEMPGCMRAEKLSHESGAKPGAAFLLKAGQELRLA